MGVWDVEETRVNKKVHPGLAWVKIQVSAYEKPEWTKKILHQEAEVPPLWLFGLFVLLLGLDLLE